jgi:hypothetical protein
MFDTIDDTNFVLYAAKNYDNPHCLETVEFYEDLARVKYIKRLFNKYDETGELRERLILNHLIVLFNVFGPTPSQRILFFKLSNHYKYLKTFLVYLNLCPEMIDGIDTSSIEVDEFMLQKLKAL